MSSDPSTVVLAWWLSGLSPYCFGPEDPGSSPGSHLFYWSGRETLRAISAH